MVRSRLVIRKVTRAALLGAFSELRSCAIRAAHEATSYNAFNRASVHFADATRAQTAIEVLNRTVGKNLDLTLCTDDEIGAFQWCINPLSISRPGCAKAAARIKNHLADYLLTAHPLQRLAAEA